MSSSTTYTCKNRGQEIKKKQINVFDSEKILFEKNEALKELELNDDDIYDNLNLNVINDEYNNKSTTEIIHDTTLIKSSNIIIISDRNCNNVHDLIEKNLNKLEKHIQKSSDKNNFRIYKKY